jgi:hypothetical protein
MVNVSTPGPRTHSIRGSYWGDWLWFVRRLDRAARGVSKAERGTLIKLLRTLGTTAERQLTEGDTNHDDYPHSKSRPRHAWEGLEHCALDAAGAGGTSVRGRRVRKALGECRHDRAL